MGCTFESRPLTPETWADLEVLFDLPGGSTVRACWISLGPHKDYAKLQRSPIMKPVDDRDVWSVVYTFVAKHHRGRTPVAHASRHAL